MIREDDHYLLHRQDHEVTVDIADSLAEINETAVPTVVNGDLYWTPESAIEDPFSALR